MSARPKISKAEIRRAITPENEARYPIIMTIKQIASLLQLSKSTVYQWNSAGTLDFAKSTRGRSPRFWRDDIIEWFFGRRGN